jgi:hypothetical protein
MESSKKKDTAVAGAGDSPAASKKKGGKAKDAQTFIPHEEVKQAAAETIQEEPIAVHAEEVDTPEDDEKRKKLEIAKLGIAETQIAAIRTKYGSLVIKGPDDKEGYKLVRAAWSEVRTLRTGLEKKGLAIRSKIAEITKAVKKEEDRLIEMLEPLEEQLQKAWKDIDDAKEKEKKDKEAAEHARLMTRINELIDMGMTLTEGFYRIGDTISMDVATLRALPDAQYEQLKTTVKKKGEELAEEKRKKDEADEKEKKRLKDEQDKLLADQQKVEEEKRQLRAERREVRQGKLEGIGFKLSVVDGIENMYFRKMAINVNKFLEMEAFEFAIFLEATTKSVKETLDEEAKQAEKERIKTERLAQIRALGFINRGEDFHFDNGFKTITHGVASLMDLDDYGFSEHFKILKDGVDEANQGKADHEEGQRKEKEALEEKKRFISASMDRAGLSFSYTAQKFYWEDKNKTIQLGWDDLLPLTEPQVSDKIAALVIEIDLAKKFTKDQADQQADKEKKEKHLNMKDKERWEHTIEDLEAALANLKPDEFKTQIYQKKATSLLDRLGITVKEFKV